MPQNSNDSRLADASEMQDDNASGANENEQGQTSFATGTTTGGGSNFGQGSAQLGGESYMQGSTANSGATYDNEKGRLGDSSTGTANEGSSSKTAGANQDVHSANNVRDSGSASNSFENRAVSGEDDLPHEGPRRNTGLEQDTNLDTGNESAGQRGQSGSWSGASSESGTD